MRVAYWPGCVNRGFTPELHGSMAAPWRRSWTSSSSSSTARAARGAGVIAEHNQELAEHAERPHLRPRAADPDGAQLMMNICSTCQGAQGECQQRLDANAEYRALVNENIKDLGLEYQQGITNKNFLWVLVQDIGLDELRSRRSSGR